MSATDSIATFEAATNEQTAPDNYEILSAYNLIPHDAGTPPVTAELYMSPNFTNPGGADVERGKTRHYVIVLNYPAGVENTVVRMNDCSTVHGSRMFRKFIENTAEEKGYTKERIDIIEEYLEN